MRTARTQHSHMLRVVGMLRCAARFSARLWHPYGKVDPREVRPDANVAGVAIKRYCGDVVKQLLHSSSSNIHARLPFIRIFKQGRFGIQDAGRDEEVLKLKLATS